MRNGLPCVFSALREMHLFFISLATATVLLGLLYFCSNKYMCDEPLPIFVGSARVSGN